jgi:hypothetical protein
VLAAAMATLALIALFVGIGPRSEASAGGLAAFGHRPRHEVHRIFSGRAHARCARRR